MIDKEEIDACYILLSNPNLTDKTKEQLEYIIGFHMENIRIQREEKIRRLGI